MKNPVNPHLETLLSDIEWSEESPSENVKVEAKKVVVEKLRTCKGCGYRYPKGEENLLNASGICDDCATW